jgi:UDP-N-acetylglucosamine acyltransferase
VAATLLLYCKEIHNMNNFSDYQKINGNFVHPTAIVYWDKIKIGTGNIIHPYAVIGGDAQHLREESTGFIEIGDNNVFREYVTVHMPTSISKLTKIGNNCLFMVLAHIAHDCIVEDNVRMSNNSILSGHVHVMTGAVLGLSCCVHQWQVIGSYTMLGMGTIVSATNKILPGKIYVGASAKGLKENTIGLERNNITPEILENEIKRFEKLHGDMHS